MKKVTLTVDILMANNFQTMEIIGPDGHRWKCGDGNFGNGMTAAGCGRALEDHLRDAYGMK